MLQTMLPVLVPIVANISFLLYEEEVLFEEVEKDYRTSYLVSMQQHNCELSCDAYMDSVEHYGIMELECECLFHVLSEMPWTQEEEEFLIQTVARYQWLYDLHHRSFKDVKKNSWREVTAIVKPHSTGKFSISMYFYGPLIHSHGSCFEFLTHLRYTLGNYHYCHER